MKLHRGRALATAAVIAIGIAVVGCSPADENGHTMPTPAVVPLPSSIHPGEGAPFTLDAHTGIGGDADAAAVLSGLVSARTGLTLQPGDDDGIRLSIASGGPAESYTIEADASSIAVTGADAAGLFYGMHTLLQLLHAQRRRLGRARRHDRRRSCASPTAASCSMSRATSLGVETVQAFIDRAASSQVQRTCTCTSATIRAGASRSTPGRCSPSSPPASEVGGDPGGFFTKDDYREIVAYAASRHMTVVPEIDLPGHTHAVGIAYPELVEAPVIDDEMRRRASSCASPPERGVPYPGTVGRALLAPDPRRAHLRLHRATCSPRSPSITPGPFLHIGGDECLGTSQTTSPCSLERVSRDRRGHRQDARRVARGRLRATTSPTSTVGQYWGFVTPTDGTARTPRTSSSAARADPLPVRRARTST